MAEFKVDTSSAVAQSEREIWKPVHVEGYEKHYSVSNLGRVRREVGGGRAQPGFILKPSTQGSGSQGGYDIVSLWKNCKRKSAKVHHLVAFAFHGAPPGEIGNRPGQYECNHKDGNKRNNRADNVGWVLVERHKDHTMATGDRHTRPDMVKLTPRSVKAIRHLNAQGVKQSALADAFQVSRQCIYQIVKRETWREV